MKRFAFIFAALAAFAISCNKEVPETPEQSAPAGMKMVTITASVDEAATKTTYTPDGTDPTLLKFSWSKGDQISVMGTDYVFYTLTAASDGPATTFTGWIPEGVTLRQEAFYPADEATNRTDGRYYFNIPMYKDLSESFSADLPMGAYSGTENYVFKHITGAAHLTFTNFPEEVETAEISIVNARLKLTGIFNAYLSGGLWTWNSKSDVAEEERTLVRKVPVVEGEAQLYMPYNGSLWWDYTSTINIKGYDADGNEYVLLKDKLMKADEASAVRGVVKPYAPLELPDYVPEVDWTTVDWTASNVVTSESVRGITEMKAFADEHYFYIRITAPTTLEWNKLYYYFGKGTGELTVSGWAWTATKVAETFDASYDKTEIKYNGSVVTTSISVDGENTNWDAAFPRKGHAITTASGDVNFAMMLYNESDFAGSAPHTSNPMMTIPLP